MKKSKQRVAPAKAGKKKVDWEEKYKQVLSQLVTLERQHKVESETQMSQTRASVIREFLSLVGDIERIAANTKGEIDADIVGLLQKKSDGVLVSLEVEVIDPKLGKKPNPEMMEISASVEKSPGGVIAEVVEKGYKDSSGIIKMAKVIVTKVVTKPAQKDEPD